MSKDVVLESNMDPEDLVPTGWKVCAILLRHIAENGLSALNEMLEDEISADEHDWWYEMLGINSMDGFLNFLIDPVDRLVRKEINGVLRMEKYKKKALLDGLKKLDGLAEEILDAYEKSLRYLDADAEYAEIFAQIAENCKIVRKLYGVLESPKLLDIHEIVNGTCIKPINYKLFECAVRYELSHEFPSDEDIVTQLGITYEYCMCFDESDGYDRCVKIYDGLNVKLVPAEGYGMSLYYLLLLFAFLGREYYDEPIYWQFNMFTKHIEWLDSYRVVDQWEKYNYISRPDILSTVSSEDRAKLAQLCGRPTFEDIIGSESMDLIVENKTFTGLEFAQYKFLYDNLNDLDKFKKLLIKESSYLYANIDMLSDCFEDFETLKAKRFFEGLYKEFIDDLYYSDKGHNTTRIAEILCEYRTESGDPSALEYPQVYSDLVEKYIQYCALQDEALLAAVKDKLEDAPMINSPETKETDSKVRKAIAMLREKGIIDHHNNVQLKKENGTNYRLSDLVSLLVEEECVVPTVGWRKFLPKWKDDEVKGSSREKDGSIKHDEFENLDYGTILKELNWQPFNKMFIMDGKSLLGEELKKRFGQHSKYYKIPLMKVVKRQDADWLKRRNRMKL